MSTAVLQKSSAVLTARGIGWLAWERLWCRCSRGLPQPVSTFELVRSELESLRPAARSHRPKAAILARFKGNNTRRPLFFTACVGMALSNNISARKKSRHGVGPAQRLQEAAVRQQRQLTGGHPTPAPDFFRATLACRGVKMSSLWAWAQKPNTTYVICHIAHSRPIAN
jgi:hypothetical protein